MDNTKKVGVLGAGMMGAEIALCFAISGYHVIVKDVSIAVAENGKKRLLGIYDKGVNKGRYKTDQKKEVFDRIIPTDIYDDLKNADLIIEAIPEDLSLKQKEFKKLDEICKSTCFFLTNTSSIPITLIGSVLSAQRISKFAGAHFFSPASIMKLVEIIPGYDTSAETVEFILACCKEIGKTPIKVRDVAGFAVNRILHAMFVEATRLLEEGVATVEDIDIACKLGLGHPVGPFQLMDLTNNALNLKVQEILLEAYGERFRPQTILRQMVYANHLGKITGRGWYNYQKN